MIEISTLTEDKSFFAKREFSSISKYKECLENFSKNFDKEVSLKTETVIFLDTNVLLRYYSISFKARTKLFEFLSKNKNRIIITPQVQIEFLKNREDIIQRFFEQVTSKIPKDFNVEIVNKMKNFLDQYKVVLKDYPFVEPGIEKYQSELENLLNNLNSEVELKKKEHIDLIYKDKLLDFLATCNQCYELNIDERNIIKKHFDFLAKNVSTENIDSIINKPNGAFPGIGDIKSKPENPYGDYIIFHEIMKYMLNKSVTAIFLTFDNSKGDWMNKNKSPHLHYTQSIYANTGKILYIVDAERALGELLNIDIDSLVSSNTDNSLYSITSESLMKIVYDSDVFIGAEIAPFSDSFIQELKINGYVSINEIEKDIKNVKYGIIQYRKDNPKLNIIGIMRCGLRIANRNYTLHVPRGLVNGLPISPELLDDYKKYAELKEK